MRHENNSHHDVSNCIGTIRVPETDQDLPRLLLKFKLAQREHSLDSWQDARYAIRTVQPLSSDDPNDSRACTKTPKHMT